MTNRSTTHQPEPQDTPKGGTPLTLLEHQILSALASGPKTSHELSVLARSRGDGRSVSPVLMSMRRRGLVEGPSVWLRKSIGLWAITGKGVEVLRTRRPRLGRGVVAYNTAPEDCDWAGWFELEPGVWVLADPGAEDALWESLMESVDEGVEA